MPSDDSPSRDINIDGRFVFIYENEPLEKLLYADYINEYDLDNSNPPFDGKWVGAFINVLNNATLIWNTPARSTTGWRFDTPAAQLVKVGKTPTSCGVCSLNLEILTPEMTWDTSLWQSYDWVGAVCYPKKGWTMFNAGSKGLGFFGMLNKEGTSVAKSWFGSITLQPINGGSAGSNSSADYWAVLNVGKKGDLFDKDPVTSTSAESIKVEAEAVLGLPDDFPKG